mmetsp:Transcript_7035/g.15242  ORF Transcript_7035/g.15242 Transcript_7035/m.15242 type:complete len:87 (+) Transcript_7035:1138-1398(+)
MFILFSEYLHFGGDATTETGKNRSQNSGCSKSSERPFGLVESRRRCALSLSETVGSLTPHTTRTKRRAQYHNVVAEGETATSCLCM